MIKRISLIALLIITCMVFVSCSEETNDLSDQASTNNSTANDQPIEEGKLGFMGGNIGQGGLMAGDGNGWVYYRSESDNWYLYKAKLDGSEKQKLSKDVPCNINVINDWVYYANFKENFSLYRIRTDGTDHQLLKSGYCSNIYVVDNKIYYDIRDDVNKAQIYCMNIDGSNDNLIIEDASLEYYYDGYLIYQKLNGGGLHLHKYDLTTGESIQLNDAYSAYTVVDETGIYYWRPDENSFNRINLDGTDDIQILTGGDHYNTCEGFIYFVRNTAKYDLHRFTIEDSSEVKLSSFGSFEFQGETIDEYVTSAYIIEGIPYARGSLSGNPNCLIHFDEEGQMTVWD